MMNKILLAIAEVGYWDSFDNEMKYNTLLVSGNSLADIGAKVENFYDKDSINEVTFSLLQEDPIHISGEVAENILKGE